MLTGNFRSVINRRVGRFGLRAKFILIFLLITLATVTAVSFSLNRIAGRILADTVGASLHNLAVNQGVAAGDLLQNQIHLLNSLSLNEILRNKVSLENSLYPESPAETAAEIAADEARWENIAETDRLAQIILTNTTADELNTFRQRFPAHKELFVTDKYGSLTAATNMTEAYNYAGQAWWRETVHNGRPFIGQPAPGADQSLNLSIAVPIYAADNTTVIGALHSTYDLASLNNLLKIASLEENALYLDLLLTDKDIPAPLLPSGSADQPAAALNETTIGRLKTTAYTPMEINGVSYLASLAPITTIDNNPLIANLGWFVLARQNKQTALTLISEQQQAIALISLLVTALSVICGLWAARYLTRPILALTTAAQAIQEGRLDVQAPVESRDEIGELALAFNSMTRRLQDSITRLEQRVAERTADLEQQSRMLDTILATTPTYFFVFDRQGRCLYASPPALTLMKLPLDAAQGKILEDAPHAFPEQFKNELAAVFEAKQVTHNTLTLHFKDRETYFEYALNPVEDESGSVVSVVATVRDVTEQKQMQEAVWHTQKMESLGILAGGVAHDFNNLLVAMLGQTSLALHKMRPDAPARRHVEKTAKAADRAADLTKQLLAYSGKGSFAMQQISLNELIQENAHLFTAVIPKSIQLNLDLASALPPLQGDPGQMQQIVMNLILNAAEAIGDKPGQITISTRCQEITANDELYWQQTQEPLTPGSYVNLRVEDNGAGMDSETLARIFDPFFTTKFTGRGLGLAAALGIVRGHKGGLRVASQPGEGTTFEVLFPAAEAALPVSAKNNDPEQMPPSLGAVLVIDDEEPVREAVSDILAMEDIRVYTAVDGQTGITLYQEHQQEIDLVLLDLSMPGLSGHQTFQALRQIDDELKIILSSGYSEAEINRQFSGENVAGFLPKPFKLDTLVQTIQRHLV